MQINKLKIVLIIIIILLVGIIGKFIKKDYLDNNTTILKSMTETEYEDKITLLNQSHEDYMNHVEESKKKIASAITDMGVETADDDTLKNMANNIRKIVKRGGGISTIQLGFIGGYDSSVRYIKFCFRCRRLYKNDNNS